MSIHREIIRILTERAAKSRASRLVVAPASIAALNCDSQVVSSQVESPKTSSTPKILQSILNPSLTRKTRDSIYYRFIDNYVMPVWCRYVRMPYERWQHASISMFLRDHGLMYDDMYSLNDPVIERAVQLLPKDIATSRYRRMMRGTHLNTIRVYLPPSEKNYDPFIPYLAPYIEEAKFQLQEEEELLGYHMWNRRMFSGGCIGLGDLEPGSHLLTGFPNMYGAGGGLRKVRH